uniref:Uncharacterized protein n=1 Tax=Tetranychus urticae TaxID=32264 RepID=T1KSI5_TETUR
MYDFFRFSSQSRFETYFLLKMADEYERYFFELSNRPLASKVFSLIPCFIC